MSASLQATFLGKSSGFILVRLCLFDTNVVSNGKLLLIEVIPSFETSHTIWIRPREKEKLEERGIDPLTSRMLSERSTI